MSLIREILNDIVSCMRNPEKATLKCSKCGGKMFFDSRRMDTVDFDSLYYKCRECRDIAWRSA